MSPSRTAPRKAFTLLELIVVIVILGILAALAIPTFAGVIEKSRNETAAASLEAVGRNAAALATFDQEGFSATVVETAIGETPYAAGSPGTLAAGMYVPNGAAGAPLPGEVRWSITGDKLGLAVLSGSGDVCAVAVGVSGAGAARCLSAGTTATGDPAASVLSASSAWVPGAPAPAPLMGASILTTTPGTNVVGSPGAETSFTPGLEYYGYSSSPISRQTGTVYSGTNAFQVAYGASTIGVTGLIAHPRGAASVLPAGTAVRSAAWVKGPAGLTVEVTGRPLAANSSYLGEGPGRKFYVMTGNWQYLLSNQWTYGAAEFRPAFQVVGKNAPNTTVFFVDDNFSGVPGVKQVTWSAARDAVSYQVLLNGNLVATTTSLSASVPAMDGTGTYEVVALAAGGAVLQRVSATPQN